MALREFYSWKLVEYGSLLASGYWYDYQETATITVAENVSQVRKAIRAESWYDIIIIPGPVIDFFTLSGPPPELPLHRRKHLSTLDQSQRISPI